MSRSPDYRSISLKLSEVLDEIGVNERMVRLRRKCTLLKEAVYNISKGITNKHTKCYCFGSQSEGSTTIGLDSDDDVLLCKRDVNVVRNWAAWKHRASNLLMVQDETTSPGYCLLQVLRTDSPEPVTDTINNDYKKDDKGRILLRNTVFNGRQRELGYQQNGPAASPHNIPGFIQMDLVPAYYCDSWPDEARAWLNRPSVGNWPSVEIKGIAQSKGCFVVPVGSKCNNMTDVEWRISTSMAERLMMFNLNTTQIRCYVMLKMLSKTYFKMNGESSITSFMSKCTLFHCIENTPALCWREENLFPCLITCICLLYDFVRNLNCPHFIIPANNLMANRINACQQSYLLHVIDRLIQQNIDMLFGVDIDNLGQRLHVKINVLPLPRHIPSPKAYEITIVTQKLYNVAGCNSGISNDCIRNVNITLPDIASKLSERIRNLRSQYYTLSSIEVEAVANFVSKLCTLIGSILASFSVYTNNTVSPAAVRWFTTGLDTDVSSSRLKLASAYYCAGDINNAECILREVEQRYTVRRVEPVCSCYRFAREPIPVKWGIQLYRNRELLNEMVAHCVTFIRCEIPITPNELRQEMFRSTEEELHNRSPYDSGWMDLAVVDSLPCLYFLQYKVYGHQRRHEERRKALSNLLKTALNEPNLGHRDTAWNLLGQCMAQENMPVDALWCYEKSLKVRPHNNTANFHKARLHGARNNPAQ